MESAHSCVRDAAHVLLTVLRRGAAERLFHEPVSDFTLKPGSGHICSLIRWLQAVR